MHSELFRIEEAADKLDLSVTTVRRFVYKGLISHRRIGRLIMFTEKDLQEFLEKSFVPTAKPAQR